jgi:hypothetical protein
MDSRFRPLLSLALQRLTWIMPIAAVRNRIRCPVGFPQAVKQGYQRASFRIDTDERSGNRTGFGAPPISRPRVYTPPPAAAFN